MEPAAAVEAVVLSRAAGVEAVAVALAAGVDAVVVALAAGVDAVVVPVMVAAPPAAGYISTSRLLARPWSRPSGFS